MAQDDGTERFHGVDRATLEMIASGATSAAGAANLDPRNLGRAKAEAIRRDRLYDLEKEQDRRQFETTLDNAASQRAAMRQEFETELAQRQMDHATALADKQLAAATAVATATQRALWAASFAAAGALIQAAAAVIK
jgi:Na+-translocating ferredoxin:NAD+ oxidoreductase RnfC subunit